MTFSRQPEVEAWIPVCSCVARSLGFPELKPEQKEAVVAFISGKDVFVCLPTGFGKTLCYIVLPALFDVARGLPSGNSIIIVVSPLNSLMHRTSCFSIQ